jgi:POT family proton-dependent oligopeptide transporter
VPRSAPDHDATGWPPGIPYIIGNEGCERFSFYGMRSILTLYLARELYVHHPMLGKTAEAAAKEHFHLFVAAVYALPMIGAVISDRLLGKYRTILWLSMVYACGNFVLALGADSPWGVWTGLGLIALGSGGIKPCVSAHVGDQFGRGNWFRLRVIYQAFYFIINFGSFFAYLLIPVIWKYAGIRVAFGIPGVLMVASVIVFWMGRNKFIHVPPRPGGKLGLLDAAASTAFFMAVGHLFFSRALPWPWLLLLSAGCIAVGALLFAWRQSIARDDGFLAITLTAIASWLRRPLTRGRRRALLAEAHRGRSGTLPGFREDDGFWAGARARFGAEAVEGPIAVLRIASVFFLVSVFWALFDQKASSWVLQAASLDLKVWGFTLLPSQIQSANPILVMLLIPYAQRILYPNAERLGLPLTPLRRMTLGILLASLATVVIALIQRAIDSHGPGTISVRWQFPAYFLLTMGEVLVSITGLEFAYSQAPRRMKSTIMGLWLLTVALGNVFVSAIALTHLPAAASFWLFAAVGAGGALLFGVRAYFYTPRDYVQE